VSRANEAAPYPASVLEHFRAPRGVGHLRPGPTVYTGRAGERRSGAEVEIGVRIGGGRIEELRFLAYGCPYLIAAASCLAEAAAGSRPDELLRWTWREAARRLHVPPERYGRLLVLEDALRACLAQVPPVYPEGH
jgi:NifU-like protein involved in Fe-S cluster formation